MKPKRHAELADPAAGSAPNRPVILLFLLLATLIVASALGAIAYTVRQQKAKEVERLQAIAELKVSQISAWLQERHGDAQFAHTSRLYAELYWRWRDTGDTVSYTHLDVYKRQLVLGGSASGEVIDIIPAVRVLQE